MKSKLVPLALITLPLLASLALVATRAHAQTAPVRLAKAPPEPLPEAQELFDNLLAPYEAAKTFRGTFDIAIKAEQNAIAEIHLETLFRTDDTGKLQRQLSRTRIVGRAKPKQQQTFLFVDDGQTQKVVLVEQKVWWNNNQRDNSAAFFSFVKPLIDQVTQSLENNEDFTPALSQSTEAGRAVLVLKSNKSKVFRATIDAQTRALISLAVKDNMTMEATNQVFDGPISDQELAWVAPADYRQVAEGEVAPPPSLGITIPGLTGESQTVN